MDPADFWLTLGLGMAVLILTGFQVRLMWRQNAIARRQEIIESARREEEGVLPGWRRMPDNETRGKNTLTRGHIFQFAVWNRGQTPELCWEAELSVHAAGRAWHYQAAFAEHGSSKFLDRSLLIPGRSARQVQFWVDAPLEDVAKFPGVWLFLRFKTVGGPKHVLVQTGDGSEPSENDILLGLRAPR